MKLDAYMRKTGLSDAEFSRLSQIHRTKVWAYRTGALAPGARSAARIVAATRGAVRLEDLIPLPHRATRRTA